MPTDAAIDDSAEDHRARVEAILTQIRADSRNANAQAAKAEKEARYYPWIALVIGVIGSGGLIGAAVLAATFLLAHR